MNEVAALGPHVQPDVSALTAEVGWADTSLKMTSDNTQCYSQWVTCLSGFEQNWSWSFPPLGFRLEGCMKLLSFSVLKWNISECGVVWISVFFQLQSRVHVNVAALAPIQLRHVWAGGWGLHKQQHIPPLLKCVQTAAANIQMQHDFNKMTVSRENEEKCHLIVPSNCATLLLLFGWWRKSHAV